MGARLKLNQVYFGGTLVVAAILGLASGSWVMFGVSLALILVANLQTGRIRPAPTGRHSHRAERLHFAAW
jgi:hypothetical protein